MLLLTIRKNIIRKHIIRKYIIRIFKTKNLLLEVIMKHSKNNAALFADARRSLLGHLSTAAWSFVFYTVLTLFLDQLSGTVQFKSQILTLLFTLAAGFTVSLFGSVLGIGLAYVFLNLAYGQPASIRNLFAPISRNQDRAVRVRFFITAGEWICLLPVQIFLFFTSWTGILSNLAVFLPLAILCGAAFIYWNTTFAMADYLYLDFPDAEAGKILRISLRMMQGNRIRLILLILRLVPMHLLGIFSFGLANIWAGCCQHACTAAFYKDMMQQASESRGRS